MDPIISQAELDETSLAWHTIVETIYKNPYIPTSEIRPSKKQIEMLAYNGQEALFGGQCGGGKSDYLLMAALQYTHVPGYSALILRRTFKHLMGDGGLIPRAKEWIGEKAKWQDKSMKYTFPSGATLSFGYYDHDDDFMQYQGGAWNFVGWDELSQFKERWFLYLFSRLRKANWVCKHCQQPLYRKRVGAPFLHSNLGTCTTPDPIPMPVGHDGMSIADVPVRVRAASNPGGPGHEFCRRRYIVPGAPKKCVRSNLDDNPGIDKVDYRKKLAELDPITRAQLEQGNWDTYEGGRFRKHWFREFWVQDDRNGDPVYFWNNEDTEGKHHNGWPTCPHGGIPVSLCWNLITVDPAASVEDQNDYTAIGVFAITPSGEIFVLEMVREKLSVEQIVPRIEGLCNDYSPMFVGIEESMLQKGIMAESRRTLNTSVQKLKHESKGKLVRATPAIIRASEGQIFIPKDDPKGKFPWIEDFMAELISFTGDEKVDSHDDQCVAKGTLITTQSGDVPIENVRVGDMVLTRYGFRLVLAAAMTNPDAELWELKTSARMKLEATANHPVWTNDNVFVRLDELAGMPGIESAERTPKRGPVYNLTVDGGEYFANGILVHNCDVMAYAVLSLIRHGICAPIIVEPEDTEHYSDRGLGIFMVN